MRKKTFLLSLLAAGVLMGGSLQAKEVQFRGINPDTKKGREGLRNPNRGFRLEIALDVTNNYNVWGKGDFYKYYNSENDKFSSDSITLYQTYFYLTDCPGRDITPAEMANMNAFLDSMRQNKQKAVLRFAYEQDFLGRVKNGPTVADIQRHAKQLKPLIEANKDVIYVVQAGMIGAWGEWHGSFHKLENDRDRRAVLEAVLDMTPKERYVQIRVPSYKNIIKDSPELYNRVSFHDDFIIIKPHVWDADMHSGTPAFDQMIAETKYSPMDGELPWGRWSVNKDPDNPDPGWIIDGIQTARRMFIHNYSTLSAKHNYKEDEKETVPYSMIHWKNEPISEEFIAENKMPVSSNYFVAIDGKKVSRNVFDYIRDHLGYRLELQKLNVSDVISKKSSATVELSLINRGFARVYNEYDVNFVLIDSKGTVYEFKTDANINDWFPYSPDDKSFKPLIHTVNGVIDASKLKPGEYKLGLWIADGSKRLKYDSGYAIKTANAETDWFVSKAGHGINILTTVKVGK